MTQSKNILGMVLCGGESTRMGSDKGLLSYENKIWAEVMKEKFDGCKMPAVVSVNANQKEIYSNYFSNDELVIDNQSLAVRGPLLGLLSVHQQFPEKNLFVLACDMIHMNVQPMKELINRFQKENVEAIAFESEKIQPLCAIYSTIGLHKIVETYRKDPQQKFSMMHVLELLNTLYLPIKEEWKSFFKNLNRQNEIEK